MWVHRALTLVSRLYCCVIRSSEVALQSVRDTDTEVPNLWFTKLKRGSKDLLSLFIVIAANEFVSSIQQSTSLYGLPYL